MALILVVHARWPKHIYYSLRSPHPHPQTFFLSTLTVSQTN